MALEVWGYNFIIEIFTPTMKFPYSKLQKLLKVSAFGDTFREKSL